MASTNKTANLSLNQWVPTDPVLMEDMNEDNRKLDAAVGGMPYVKLFDITTTADAQQVDLDVSRIDFSKYAMVQIFSNAVSRKIDNSTNSSNYTEMRINGGGGYWSRSAYNADNAFSDYVANYHRNDSGGAQIRADISGFQQHPATTDSTSSIVLLIRSIGATRSAISSGYCSKHLSKAAEFVTINFLSDNASFKIKAGSRFVMYGVKL